mmetsp:Transcript_54221/g.116393  ORF Transcript_54221/g.116393 Transcript_54221/m.116393 type:complete len:84 (-) Transcript_54221:91-342(-)
MGCTSSMMDSATAVRNEKTPAENILEREGEIAPAMRREDIATLRQWEWKAATLLTSGNGFADSKKGFADTKMGPDTITAAAGK